MPTWTTHRICLVSMLGLAASTSWAADKTFDQHFTAPPGGKLVVDTDDGAVTVTGHDSRDLTVHADISGTGAEDIKFTAEQNASGVTVLGREPSGKGWFHLGTGPKVRITIETPRDYPVEVKSAGGALDVRGVSAAVRGSTSGGGIELHDIGGPVDMHTSGGAIDAESIKGATRLRSSGGHIDLSNVVGDIDVHTSGGGIELLNVDGKISADTSGGGVRVEARSNHGISLSSSGGPIRLSIPADIHGSLDAETSGGRVRSQIPLTVSELSESDHVRGQINGGGDPISLHTSGGGIEISPLNAH
jgi:hypothetical protein